MEFLSTMRTTRILFAILAIIVCSPHSLRAADLYLVNADSQSVRRYTDQGDFVSNFVAPGAGGLVEPSGLAFGPDGNLYVADNSLDQILRYSANGTFIDVFASDPLLDGPTDLVFRGDDLFAGLWNNAGSTGGIARIDANTGALETTFGTGNFRRTHAIEFGSDGSLYASSFDTRSIRVFNPETGAFIREFGSASTVDRPMGIIFDENENLIVNNWNGDVRLIDPTDGSVISTLASGLSNTQWTTFAPDGTLILDNYGAQALGRFETDGTFIELFATLGFSPDKFIFYQAIPEPQTAIGLISMVTVAMVCRGRRTESVEEQNNILR